MTMGEKLAMLRKRKGIRISGKMEVESASQIKEEMGDYKI